MRILISNKIYLYGFPETMKTAIKRGLTIPNPMYEQMLRRAKYSGNKKWVRALYGIKRNFKYYEEKDDALIIGRGNENKLIKFLEKHGVSLLVEYDLAQTKNELKLKGEIELRDYQKGIIEEILEHRLGVLKLSTGYGKTIIALKMIEATRLPTLIVVHQDKELAKYISDLKRFYGYKAGVIKGDKADIRDVTIGSIATMCRRDLSQLKYRFPMIIVDECFDGNVFVETANQIKKIKDIVIGDVVRNAIGMGVVTAVIKKNIDCLIDVRFSNGTNILVTSNHPFFSICGWTKIEDFNNGDIVFTTNFINDIMSKGIKSLIKIYGKEQMRVLWKEFCTKTEVYKKKNMLTRLSLLFNIQKKTAEIIGFYAEIIKKESRNVQETGGKISEICKKPPRTQTKNIYHDEIEQPIKESENKKKNIGYFKNDWTQTHGTWWERPRYASATENIISCARERVVGRIYNSKKMFQAKDFWRKITDKLQDRHCKSIAHDSDRSRWWLSLFNSQTKARQKKGESIAFTRVESIAIQKQGHNGEFNSGFTVYNLSVDKHPSYSVNGLLVHNCQTMVSSKRIETIQSFAPQRLYAMSGTPDRDDGTANAIFYTFGNIIIDRELPQKLPTVKIVKSNIEIPVDDYADMITGMIESAPRNDLIVKLCKEQVALKRKVLILVKRVAHCEALSCVLKSFGYKTYHIQSKLSVDERKKQYDLLEKLGKGNNNFDIIIGTLSLLGVGANFPALDTLIFGGDLRARVLGRQAVGRILRLMEGKQDPLVIDIVDNLNPILLSQARARKSLYRDNGWEII